MTARFQERRMTGLGREESFEVPKTCRSRLQDSARSSRPGNCVPIAVVQGSKITSLQYPDLSGTGSQSRGKGYFTLRSTPFAFSNL